MVLSPSVCGHLLRPPKDTDSGVVISETVPRGRRTCPRGLPFVLSPQSSPDSSRPSAVIKSTGSGHEPRGGQDLGHLLPPRCPAALRGAQPLLAGRWAPRPFSARSLSRWAPAPLDPWSQTIQAIRPLGSGGGGVATRPCHPACPGLGRGKNGAFVSLANIDRAAPGCWARPCPRLELAGLHITLLPPHTRSAGDAKALTFQTTARAENVSLHTVWEECLVPAQLLEFFFLFFPSDVAPSSGLSINAEPQQPLSRSETAPACGRHRRLARGGDRNPLPFTMHSSCWFWTRHRSEGRER